jgi:hypothetical protein
MHTVSVARKLSLGALVALALVVGALFAAAPTASANTEQCSANTVCVWESRDFRGNFSWWYEWDRGCHEHGGNPQIRSWWNRTGHEVTAGRAGNIGHNPGWIGEGYINGLICW